MQSETKFLAGIMVSLALATSALIVLPYVQLRPLKPPKRLRLKPPPKKLRLKPPLKRPPLKRLRPLKLKKRPRPRTRRPSPGGRGLERTSAKRSFWRERVRGYGVRSLRP